MRPPFLVLPWLATTTDATISSPTTATEQDKCVFPVTREFGGPVASAFDSSRGPIDYGVGIAETSLGMACGEFRRATCCSKKHTDVVWKLIVAEQRNHFNAACMSITDRVKCATLCDPDVGTGRKEPIICRNACDEWFAACAQEFWAPPSANMPLYPCHDQALVCSRLVDSYASGTEFCQAMGIRVADTETCITTRADPNRRGVSLHTTSTRSTSGDMTGLFKQLESLLPWFLRPTVLDDISNIMMKKIADKREFGLLIMTVLLAFGFLAVFIGNRKRANDAVGGGDAPPPSSSRHVTTTTTNDDFE